MPLANSLFFFRVVGCHHFISKFTSIIIISPRLFSFFSFARKFSQQLKFLRQIDGGHPDREEPQDCEQRLDYEQQRSNRVDDCVVDAGKGANDEENQQEIHDGHQKLQEQFLVGPKVVDEGEVGDDRDEQHRAHDGAVRGSVADDEPDGEADDGEDVDDGEFREAIRESIDDGLCDFPEDDVGFCDSPSTAVTAGAAGAASTLFASLLFSGSGADVFDASAYSWTPPFTLW